MHPPFPLSAVATPASPPVSVDLTALGAEALPVVLNLLGALAILLLGWLVAGVAAKICRTVLRRLAVDERLSRTLSGRGEGIKPPALESLALHRGVLDRDRAGPAGGA